MTNCEIGAYMRIVTYYWATGRLPTDDGMLQRIGRIKGRDWERSGGRIKSALAPAWEDLEAQRRKIAETQPGRTARASAGGRAKAMAYAA